MKFRLYNDETGEGSSDADVGRIGSNAELMRHWGQGGSQEWRKLCPVQNLAAIEAELDIIDAEFQRIADADAAQGEECETAYDHATLNMRLEAHAWRRCLHVSLRLNHMPRVDLAVVRRFVDAVLRMQRLMKLANEDAQGFVLCAGIQLRAETADQLMQLFGQRAAEQTSA